MLEKTVNDFKYKGFMLFVAMVLGGCLFSCSAYATAPYLNFSSSAPTGLVSFEKVQPSSIGTMSTASDTLTVNTNCTVGYNVYVSATSSGDTNLTNDSAATANVISASSATVGGTSAVLAADTWGVNGSSTDAADGKYFGLPTYAQATTNPLVTKTSVNTTSTVPIYYGAKVTTALAPGSYAGDVLYTVLPNTACTYYTVHYNANSGTGTMNNQTITVGQATKLTANAYTRSGYTFLGWSNSASGKTGTAVNGVGTAADVDYADAQEVTDIADFNTTKNLYAIWGLISADMQSWTGCNSMAVSTTLYLQDTRDSQGYGVYRFATSGTAGTAYPTGLAGACIMTKDMNYANPSSGSTTSSEDTTYRVYNYAAATSVCPAGWRLPTQTEYNNIASFMGGNNSTGSTNIRNTPYSFKYGGYYGSSWADVGTAGYYWSSTENGSSNAYGLYIAASNLNTSSQAKTNQLSVRCIVEKNYTVNYSANGATSGSPSKTTDGNQFESASVTTATVGTMAKTGYHFLGWSTSSSAASAAYNAGADVSVSTLATAAGASSGGTITLYAVWAANTFTINYNANGGTGAASPTSATATYGTNVTMAAKNTLAKSGYDFLGWSLSSTATTATWTAGQTGVAPTAIKSNVTTTNGGSVTVYAVWKSSVVYFQTANSCSTITQGTTGTLVDNRDNQSYTVYRWTTSSAPSSMGGYCIMTKDLSLGYVTGGSITKGSNLTLTTDSSAGSGTISARTGTSDWSTTNSDSNLQYINGTDATYGTHSYYSYGAAQAVCPKGWRPPTNAEYGNIKTFMGGDNSTGSSTIRSAPYNFVYGGYFYSSGWYNVGSYGYYWSSTQNSSTYGYDLGFSSSNLYTNGSNKYYGRSVRCVASS